MINELLQWAALAFMGVFLIGLTRQLAQFLTDPKEQYARETGPPQGKAIPDYLLTRSERKQVGELFASSDAAWGAILVVADNCIGCKAMLERLAESGVPDGAPLVVISRQSDEDHRRQLEVIADVVVVDAKRLSRADLLVSPFVIMFDRKFRVVHKAITPDLAFTAAEWKGTEDSGEPAANGHPADARLAVTQVGSDGGSA
jgi:hypothetical protein